MTDDKALWTTLRRHLPRRTWIPIADIYDIVQNRVRLDAEDLDCRLSRSATPRWKFNVRRLLRSKHREGRLMRRMTP